MGWTYSLKWYGVKVMKSALGLTIMTTVLKCMEPMRSIRQSCNTIVGMATGELKCGVWRLQNGKNELMRC